MLQKNDAIYCLFKEYKQKISQDAEKNNEHVYGVDQMASRLAVAHIIHKVFTENVPPTAKKVNKTWETTAIPDDSTETSGSSSTTTITYRGIKY